MAVNECCYVVGRGFASAESSAISLTSASSVASDRRARREQAAAGDDAVLAIREQCRQLQERDLERDHKLKQLTAQLARTEEAAKRLLVNRCPDARRGVAQQLLRAERDLDEARSERAQLSRLLAS